MLPGACNHGFFPLSPREKDPFPQTIAHSIRVAYDLVMWFGLECVSAFFPGTAMALVLFLIFSVFSVSVEADYECLCSYKIEMPVNVAVCINHSCCIASV